MHGLRRHRHPHLGGATRTPTAFPAARLGRTRRRGNLGQRRVGDPGGADPRLDRPRAAGRDRHHQPARDHAGLGPGHRPTGGQRHRLAGHPNRPAATPARRDVRRGTAPGPYRPAAGHLLRRAEADVAAGRGRRAARAGDARRGALRHHGELADLEADRPARHRRDERQPYVADGPAHAGLGSGDPGPDGDPGGDAAGDPPLRRDLRYGHRRARRGAGRQRAGRPAGRPVRADLFRARRGQVHLRHRQLPAAQHRHRAGRVRPRAADHGRLPDRRRAGDVRAGGGDRGHRVTGPVAARQPRTDLRRTGGGGTGPQRRGQRRLLRRTGVLRPVRTALAHATRAG